MSVDGATVTRITNESELVGGLMVGADSAHHPVRLQAVTAAVGMALQLRNLNEKVTAQLKEVEASRERIVEASDQARRRMERDLHDGAQQQLVALGLDLQRARRLATGADDSDMVAILEGAIQLLRDTIADIRHVSRGSDPPLLADRGLPAAVDALVERSPIPVDVGFSGGELPSATARTAYFVIAESLTNVAKHARATSAEVKVEATNGFALVEIKDDGLGGAALQTGGGLQGLEDRTAAAGGSFHVESSDSGTIVRAVIPCG